MQQHKGAFRSRGKSTGTPALHTFRLLSAYAGTFPVDTGDCCLKARRIPFGLLYIATLILVIVLIPLIQFSGSQSSALAHRLSSATTLRMDKMTP